jgi:serine/threonine-protein kinase
MGTSNDEESFSVVLDELPTKNETSGPQRAAPATDQGPVSATGAILLQSRALTAPPGLHEATAPGEPGGERLGRYTLISRLGKGGMAEVFLARQDGPAGFQKHVVIKKSDPELAKNPRFVDMFLREARIAAILNHTNVVQVFELGQEGDTYYIAMEHIDGISLHRAARRAWQLGESIPMEVVVKCIADAARGLHYAHTWKVDGRPAGLVHRDISPDNLMLTRDGVTKVLDFGIAKMSVDDGEPVTKTGELKGKIPYMSPEQLKGEVLDGRADLWSLGVTLYWLLTGARPFAGGNEIATLQAILHDEPMPLRHVNPLVPVPLERLTLRLLRKDRNERFASGQEVADALLAMLGPVASSNAAADFALRMLALEDGERAGAPQTGRSQSVQTVVAAKPQTEWLMKAAPVEVAAEAHWQGIITGASSADAARAAPPPPAPTPTPAPAPPEARPSSSSLLTRGVVAGAAVAAVLLGVVAFVYRESSSQGPSAPPPSPPAVVVAPAPPPSVSTSPPVPVPAPSPSMPAPPPSVPAPTPPSVPTSAPPPAPPPAPKIVRTPTVAPEGIRWESASGKVLGRGAGGVVLADGVRSVVAVDSVTGGRTTVELVDGRFDYTAIGRGRLVIRAQPWAEVALGTKDLGTTPFEPVMLVAGTYTVRLRHEGRVVDREVTISPGREAIVAVNMLK